MKEIGLEEHKRIQLNILDKFDKYCKEHSLTYFLAYGSLIGAIRHNGFIPWDDDTDVVMPRQDYLKLMEDFNATNSDTDLELISPFEKKAKHPYAKLIDTRTVKIEKGIKYESENEYLGVDIDIFPIDGQPDDVQIYNKWRKELIKCYAPYAVMCLDIAQMRWWTKARILCYRLLYKDKNNLLVRAQRLHEKYPYDKCQYVGVCESCYDSAEDRAKKECYEYPIQHDFEGILVNIPVGYDTILRNIYGDYMQLPPPEKRRTHHSNKVYWKDSYDDVMVTP